jgi:oxygen-independent coproporphyrinogen III oxidase
MSNRYAPGRARFDRRVESVEPFAHLYVHVPFCRHKCGYCDFNAYAGMDRLMPAYQEALEHELERARGRLPFETLRTVYFGGGTPSLLPAELAARMLAQVRATFEIDPDAEVTLEANPASTDVEKLACWREGGVNRLSLGVQGFDPSALGVLERRSDGRQAEAAFRMAREAGFENISLDLIYAVPHQSLDSWLRTVERALELGSDHLSCYCLGFEEGTLLHRRRQLGKIPEVEADQAWEQLDAADRLLSTAGFERYEVSSWALPGRRSSHNSAYWSCRPVYGAGAGAHSYAASESGARRWWNVGRPRDYIAAVQAGTEEADHEDLGMRQAAAERLMLGLRTRAGLRPPEGFEAELAALERSGLVERTGGLTRPTRRGLDLHNQVALAVL